MAPKPLPEENSVFISAVNDFYKDEKRLPTPRDGIKHAPEGFTWSVTVRYSKERELTPAGVLFHTYANLPPRLITLMTKPKIKKENSTSSQLDAEEPQPKLTDEQALAEWKSMLAGRTINKRTL